MMMEVELQKEPKKLDYYFGKCKIDSLIIRIPYTQVRDNTKMSEPLQTTGVESGVVYESGFSEMKVLCEVDGVKCRADRKVYFIGGSDKQQRHEVLAIGITAMMLGDRYWEGITSENIVVVYDWLQKNVDIQFDFQTFLSGSISDVDFCIDVPADRDSWSEFIGQTWSMITIASEKYCNQFVKKNHKRQGISFNNRAGATPTRPFVKLYFKDGKFEDDESHNFFNQKFFDGRKHNVGRFEQTFKSRQEFWNRIEEFQKPQNLWELLMCSIERIGNYCKTCLPKFYLEKRIWAKRINKNLMQPNDYIVYTLMSALVENGWSRDRFRSIAKMYERDYDLVATQKQRMRDKIDFYYDEFVGVADKETIDRLEKNSKVDKIGIELGIWE